MPGTNFRYIQFFTSSGVGYGCFSMSWEKTGTTLKYLAGVSFCNPKDAFQKEQARKMSEGRRANNRNENVVSGTITSSNPDVKFVTNDDFTQVLQDFMERGRDLGSVPSWAYNAFRRGKFRLGLRQESHTTPAKTA